MHQMVNKIISLIGKFRCKGYNYLNDGFELLKIGLHFHYHNLTEGRDPSRGPSQITVQIHEQYTFQ